MLNHWAVFAGAVLAERRLTPEALSFAALMSAWIASSFLLVSGVLVLLAYRKDRLATWNRRIRTGGVGWSILILWCSLASGIGGLLLLRCGSVAEGVAAGAMFLGTLVAVSETAVLLTTLFQGGNVDSPKTEAL